ncbi:MAG: hypothetical protein KIT80_10695 [Chitinophagaceae bacterium]|nr:hypothetical protein [Chitinophagaceae bacterium]MCW5927370.1 hypothetical protein [Chitinophagaceae bacterium]
MKYLRYLVIILSGCSVWSLQAQNTVNPSPLASLMKNPDAGKWTLQSSIPLQFATHHTQGLLKIGDYFYLSAVEVRSWPKPYGRIINGYDRDTGDGTGRLFKFDQAGKLVAQIQLGEGNIYHPGGIDFDGEYIWVPVCEYRPFGPSILYRVDPNTMKAVKTVGCPDAIGAVAFNRSTNELIGMNWNARDFYRWKYSREGNLQFLNKEKNNHHFISYQDCQYIGNGTMLCSGLRNYRLTDGSRFRLGGLQAIKLSDYSSLWETPVPVWVGSGASLNNNPFFAEQTAEKLLLYFIPEDDHSTMYIYAVE